MTTLGVIVGNRGFFPSELCKDGRERIIKVLEEEGFKAILLSVEETPYGSVETYEHSKKCAALFKKHRDEIDGILVTLPNFGEERGIVDAIRLSELNVPILVQAFSDDINKMSNANRRDGFCGKMSVCNNLLQYNIPYSLTTLHTVDPETKSFREDIQKFGAVCRVVKGMRKARFGQIGARPTAFNTVRYSEKLLEQSGITVETLDLSEIFGQANRLANDDLSVKNKITAIKNYVKTTNIPEDALLKMAKFAVVVDEFVTSRDLVGTAIQCWTSMEEYFGVVPCTIMSMLSNNLQPSACETDITGLVGMYAMVLASGKPSALLDWNNNFGDDPNKGVLFHCSNLPIDLFEKQVEMDYQAIIAGTVGKENTYGTLVGKMKHTKATYCRVSTDDYTGQIAVYLGEAEITDDVLNTFGGYGVVKIPEFQTLLRFICENGFEHHVAINPSQVAEALNEAFTKYLGWNVYYHQG